MLARVAALKQSGMNVIVLLALSDNGHPAFNNDHAVKIAGRYCPVFGCTPDQFPELMAVALTGRGIEQWAGGFEGHRTGAGPMSRRARDFT